MNLVSTLVETAFKQREAERAKLTTPLSYWCNHFDNFAFPPQQFYALVEKNLAPRQVPDLLQDFILLHEGTAFSRKRLYIQMRRERIVFEICAAPFGSGYFVSSRLFDRRRDATLLDYLIAALIAGLLSFGVLARYGPIVAIVVFGLVFTIVWSLMRLAASGDAAWWDEKLCQVPWVGRIYESLFHPDTYFRQDQTNMYRAAVHKAVIESVNQMTAEKGIRPLSDSESHPTLADLHRR
ncbi:MAG: hypothetical protein HY735_36810 [Verrucomicrobia bacterium]|nr:hypothetical protein [Verrucomicrobiota bacterium]